MTLTVERIKGEIYLSSAWLESQEPIRHVCKWKAEGPTIRVPDEVIGRGFPSFSLGMNKAVSLPCGPFGRIEIYLPGNAKAAIVERIPVPEPKVRKDTRLKWSDSGWQKYSKRDGWVAA